MFQKNGEKARFRSTQNPIKITIRKSLKIKYHFSAKIQGIYFKIQGTYFKISALYFLQHGLCFSAHPKTHHFLWRKSNGKSQEIPRTHHGFNC